MGRSIQKYTRRGDGTTEIAVVRRNGDRHVILIDTDNEHIARRFRWHVIRLPHHYYARTTQYDLCGQVYYHYLHRLLMDDELRDGLEVHHVNNDGLDCRRANLRAVTRREVTVLQLSRKPSNTGERNIHLTPCGKYTVRIQWDQVELYGSFDTMAEAVRWRDGRLEELGYRAAGRRLVKL